MKLYTVRTVDATLFFSVVTKLQCSVTTSVGPWFVSYKFRVHKFQVPIALARYGAQRGDAELSLEINR
jgi:hypothetical protein